MGEEWWRWWRHRQCMRVMGNEKSPCTSYMYFCEHNTPTVFLAAVLPHKW